jgi:hypothetical protein
MLTLLCLLSKTSKIVILLPSIPYPWVSDYPNGVANVRGMVSVWTIPRGARAAEFVVLAQIAPIWGLILLAQLMLNYS